MKTFEKAAEYMRLREQDSYQRELRLLTRGAQALLNDGMNSSPGLSAPFLDALYLKACGEMVELQSLSPFFEPRSTPVLFFGRSDLAREGGIVTVGINPSGEEFRSLRPRLLRLDAGQELSDAAGEPAWISRAVAWQRAYFSEAVYEGQRIGGNPYIDRGDWFSEVEAFLRLCSSSYFDTAELLPAFHLDVVTHIATKRSWGDEMNAPIRGVLAAQSASCREFLSQCVAVGSRFLVFGPTAFGDFKRALRCGEESLHLISRLDEPEFQRRLGFNSHHGRGTHYFERHQIASSGAEVWYVNPYNTRPFMEIFSRHPDWDPLLSKDERRARYIKAVSRWFQGR